MPLHTVAFYSGAPDNFRSPQGTTNPTTSIMKLANYFKLMRLEVYSPVHEYINVAQCHFLKVIFHILCQNFPVFSKASNIHLCSFLGRWQK